MLGDLSTTPVRFGDPDERCSPDVVTFLTQYWGCALGGRSNQARLLLDSL